MMKGKNSKEIPIRITDTTLRDGHQSLLATRMRIKDMEALAPEMDGAGFYSLKCGVALPSMSASDFSTKIPGKGCVS